MNCPLCGSSVLAGSLECELCGYSLEEAGRGTTPPGAAAPAAGHRPAAGRRPTARSAGPAGGPSRGAGGRATAIGALVVTCLAVVVALAWLGSRPSEDRAAAGTSVTPDPAPVVPSEVSAPTAGASSIGDSTGSTTAENGGGGETTALTPEEAATNRLKEYLEGDRSAVAAVFDGRLVAKLASKVDGTTDPLQTTDSGSHTFRWSDVLTEHERFRDRFPGQVLLIASNEVGDRTIDSVTGLPYLITFYVDDFDSRADVFAWCRRAFPGLSGRALDNQCVPMRLSVT